MSVTAQYASAVETVRRSWIPDKGMALDPESSYRSETLRRRSEKMRAWCAEVTDSDSE